MPVGDKSLRGVVLQGEMNENLTHKTHHAARLGALSASLAAALALAGAAAASCLPQTAAEQRAQANVIFDGVALDGPTATGIQRFRVHRYLKGSGPATVRVATGVVRKPDGSGSITSVSLLVRRGEHWRIFARGKVSKVLQSNQCNGSRKL